MNYGNKIMNVAFCCDDNYLMPASIMIESLLKHSTGCHLVLYTFSDDLNDLSQAKLNDIVNNYDAELHFLKMPSSAKELLENVHLAFEYLSVTTYYRLLLPYVLDSTVERVLYVDCDVLVRKNPYRYYKALKPDKLILGADDIEKKQHCERLGLSHYVNAGVLVMNLKAIRDNYSFDTMLCKMRELMAVPNYLKLGDQDIINILYQKGIIIASDFFNYQHVIHKKYIINHLKDLKKVVIVHYITEDKPWKGSYVFPFSLEYYHYLKKYQTLTGNVNWWMKKPIGIYNIVKKRREWIKQESAG